MSVIKTFTINKNFRSASNRALVKNLPSDLLYTLGAALYDKSERATTYSRKEFYRKTLEKVLKTVNEIRAMENKYHA